MKIVLSSRGSRGDVNPIIEIATALHRQGHSISICVPVLFNDLCRQRGITPSLYPEDSEDMMKGLGSGIKAIQTALTWFSESIEEQFAFMLDATADADIMVTSVNELAAPTVAEYRSIPHYRIAYTPVLPGYHPPPLIPWQQLPAIGNRAMWYILNGLTGLFIRRFINRKRIELGMDPIGSIGNYFTAGNHTILAINETLAPPCRSWHKNYRFSYSGYCYGDIDGDLDPGLSHFLASGPPPVYIGFGSVNLKDPEGFTDLVIEAAEKAGARIILGSGWTGLGRENLPDTVYCVGDTSHATLFPRCSALIHHGGCGTTHTAARAGVPQFIMPQIADQFYWGNRIYRLGLGPAPIIPGRITVQKLSAILSDLAGNETYRMAARALGEEMIAENGVPSIVKTVSSTTGWPPSKKGNPFSERRI